jgi:hypothetical protein
MVLTRRAMRLGVGKRMKKVWRELVGCRPRNEGGCGVSPWLSLEEKYGVK